MSPKIRFIAFLDQISSAIPSFSRALTHLRDTAQIAKRSKPEGWSFSFRSFSAFLAGHSFEASVGSSGKTPRDGWRPGSRNRGCSWMFNKTRSKSFYLACSDMFQSTCHQLVQDGERKMNNAWWCTNEWLCDVHAQAMPGEAVDHAWVQRFVASHTRLVELGCRLEASVNCLTAVFTDQLTWCGWRAQ